MLITPFYNTCYFSKEFMFFSSGILINSITKSLIIFKKGISETQDPETFGEIWDLRPGTHHMGGTQDHRPCLSSSRTETQDAYCIKSLTHKTGDHKTGILIFRGTETVRLRRIYAPGYWVKFRHFWGVIETMTKANK